MFHLQEAMFDEKVDPAGLEPAAFALRAGRGRIAGAMHLQVAPWALRLPDQGSNLETIRLTGGRAANCATGERASPKRAGAGLECRAAGSNCRPAPYEGAALPIELARRCYGVGQASVDLAASRLKGACSTN